jgi:gliding motility associated protien GldN
MKNKIFVAFLLLVSLGLATVLQAQSTGHKKRRHKKTQHNADSVAAAKAMDTVAKAPVAVAEPTPISAGDTMHTDGLIADTGMPSYTYFPIDTSKPVDGMYKIPMLKGAKPFAIPKENAYDIKFYKRLWRTIDLHDSVNKVFAMPGETLVSLILSSIKAGKLIAYSDEKFTKALTYSAVMKSLTDSQTVSQFDSTGQEIGTRTIFNDFNPDSITKYEMKEDIYFDKVRGRLISQIVGLAPIKALKTSSGDYIGDTHPFWLYFPQCRIPFAGKDIYDTQRDIYNISFDDIFIQRNFRTLIVKESNPGDYRIKDLYPDEAKQKQESDRIEAELRNFKKDIWKY